MEESGCVIINVLRQHLPVGSKTIKNTALPKFGLEASSVKLLTKTAAVVCENSMIQSFYIPRNLQDINTICGQTRSRSL